MYIFLSSERERVLLERVLCVLASRKHRIGVDPSGFEPLTSSVSGKRSKPTDLRVQRNHHQHHEYNNLFGMIQSKNALSLRIAPAGFGLKNDTNTEDSIAEKHCATHLQFLRTYTVC